MKNQSDFKNISNHFLKTCKNIYYNNIKELTKLIKINYIFNLKEV